MLFINHHRTGLRAMRIPLGWELLATPNLACGLHLCRTNGPDNLRISFQLLERATTSGSIWDCPVGFISHAALKSALVLGQNFSCGWNFGSSTNGTANMIM